MREQKGPEKVARILVIDDSRVSALKLAKSVRALGHEVETAANGIEGIAHLEDHEIDLILLDIVMPEMDGFDVLRALKGNDEHKDIPVIVVSSLDDEILSVVQAIELGAVDFLPKTYEPAILRARIESSLTQKRFRDREREYFRDVEQLTRAAEVIEAGAFRPSELDLDGVLIRTDSLGRLAAVFRGLAQEIYEREKKLDRTVRTMRGTLLVLVAGGIFGISPALGRMAGGLGAPTMGIVVWANMVAAILCLAVAGWRGKFSLPKPVELPFFVGWALILGCLYQIFNVMISQYIEASTIALVGSSRGFMVFGLAALLAVEPPSLRRVAGLGIGFLAVTGVLMLRGADDEGLDKFWLAAAFALPFLLAVHTLLMSWRPSEMDAFAAVGIMMALSSVMLAPLALATDAMYWPSNSIGRIEIIIFVLGLATGVALALALDLVATAGAVFASQMGYSQTLAGIAWGMLLLGETLPIIAWAAFGLVILGVWLVEPKQAGEEFSLKWTLKRP